jgi:hypothetical protein
VRLADVALYFGNGGRGDVVAALAIVGGLLGLVAERAEGDNDQAVIPFVEQGGDVVA